MKSKVFITENSLWEAIEECIGKQQTTRYARQIEQAVPVFYDQDKLRSRRNHDFMFDPSFRNAYERGVLAAQQDYSIHWRAHIGLWAAFSASKLDGDFVECGVNRGFLSSAIMQYLDWNALDKHFYLLDTFTGIDERTISEREISAGVLDMNQKRIEKGFYTTEVESVRANFSEWKNVHIIQGAIPDTLPDVETNRIAYLHIDMNCAVPEIAAIDFFWDRLVPGAFIVLDDYGFRESPEQKSGMDAFAVQHGVQIASLPTGQGLLIKPPLNP